MILNPLKEVTFRTRAVGSAGGIILSGPSGSGKTCLVKAVTSRLPASVDTKYIKASQIVTPFPQGTSLRHLVLESVRSGTKCTLLIIDDAHCLSRSQPNEARADGAKLLISLLEDTSLPPLCIVLIVSDAATLSPSLRRSHHFQRELRVKPPSMAHRQGTISELLASESVCSCCLCELACLTVTNAE